MPTGRGVSAVTIELIQRLAKSLTVRQIMARTGLSWSTVMKYKPRVKR